MIVPGNQSGIDSVAVSVMAVLAKQSGVNRSPLSPLYLTAEMEGEG